MTFDDGFWWFGSLLVPPSSVNCKYTLGWTLMDPPILFNLRRTLIIILLAGPRAQHCVRGPHAPHDPHPMPIRPRPFGMGCVCTHFHSFSGSLRILRSNSIFEEYWNIVFNNIRPKISNLLSTLFICSKLVPLIQMLGNFQLTIRILSQWNSWNDYYCGDFFWVFETLKHF